MDDRMDEKLQVNWAKVLKHRFTRWRAGKVILSKPLCSRVSWSLKGVWIFQGAEGRGVAERRKHAIRRVLWGDSERGESMVFPPERQRSGLWKEG